jgi:RecA-family ATPase
MTDDIYIWSVVSLNAKDSQFGPLLNYSDGHFRRNADALADGTRSKPDVEFAVVIKTARRKEIFETFYARLLQEDAESRETLNATRQGETR